MSSPDVAAVNDECRFGGAEDVERCGDGVGAPVRITDDTQHPCCRSLRPTARASTTIPASKKRGADCRDLKWKWQWLREQSCAAFGISASFAQNWSRADVLMLWLLHRTIRGALNFDQCDG